MTQTKQLSRKTSPLPDIAFTKDDVSFARNLLVYGHGTSMSVLLHNIGGKHTGPITINLSEICKNGDIKIIDSVCFSGIDAPHDFLPKTEPVALAGYVSKLAEKLVITVDPDNEIDELYEKNNSVEIPVIE